MGGLSVSSFLANNPNLNISGAVLSSPLMNMPEEAGLNTVKKLAISLLKPVLDNLVVNPMIPVH